MKRVLTFLVLFGAGLGVLLWIDRSRREDPPEQVEPVAVDGPDRPAATPGGDDAPEPDGGPDSAGGEGQDDPRSRFDLGPGGGWTRFDLEGTRRRVLDLSFDDSRRADAGAIELLTVVIELFDPGTGDLRATLVSDSGLVEVAEGPGVLDVELSSEEILLREVTVTLFDGTPFVPLTLVTSSLRVDQEHQTFATDQRVTIESDGFRANGVGLDGDIARGTFAIRRESWSEIVLPDAPRVELVADGPLGIERDDESEDGARSLRVVAREAARLLVHGEQESELSAHRIELAGREQPRDRRDEPRSFGLERIVARRDARFISDELELEADVAELFFGADGALEEGDLTGFPRARMRIALAGAEDVPEVARRADGLLEIVGSSTLHFERDEELVLNAPGPAEIVWADARLNALGGVRGRSSLDGSAASLSAWQEVLLTHEGGTLATPELNSTFAIDEDDSVSLVSTAAAPATVIGETSEGRPFTFATEGELEFELRDEDWAVPRADGVEVAVEGENGFRARAASVTDFDPERFAFDARGDVDIVGRFQDEPLRARGERLSAESRDSFLLEGTAETPATFRGRFGEGSAEQVELRGELLYARGSVEAEFEDQGLAYDLACDSFEVQRRPSENPAALDLLEVVVHAEGDVRGGVSWPDRGFEMSCSALDVQRTEWPAPEGFPSGRSEVLLIASNVERGTVHIDQGEDARPETWTLVCNRLEAHRDEDADGTSLREDLLASGQVQVYRPDEINATFVGRGDRLSFDGSGQGRLYRASDRLVTASGSLPGSQIPFTCNANWIEFSEFSVRASYPDIELVRTREREDENGEVVLEPDPVRARAQLLVADERSARLSGNVRLDGEMGDGQPWVLQTREARVESGTPGPEVEGPETGSVFANGGFLFRMRDVRAEGEAFSAAAESGLIYLEGAPAKLSFGGLEAESESFVFDSVTYSIRRAGAGSMRPIPLIGRAP